MIWYLVLTMFVQLFFMAPAESDNLVSIYNVEEAFNHSSSELDFWTNKINSSPNGFIYLSKTAQANRKLFDITGDIEYLKKSEDALSQRLKHPIKDPAPVMCALAHNLIAQHKFCDALDHTLAAASIYSQPRMVHCQLFDIYMELGWQELAEQQLQLLYAQRDFDYLIRKAKLEDAKGNLNTAVAFLEKARTIAEAADQVDRLSWIHSNLGDFYGHQNDIKNSRNSYKKALEINSSDAHSLKGLAWIAYSNDRDYAEALNLMNRILEFKVTPDYLMLKSQILKSMKLDKESKRLAEKSYLLASKKEYGIMYNELIIDYMLVHGDQPKSAIRLLENEISERPVAEKYAHLVLVHEQCGNWEEARQLAIDKVLHQTYEPKALLRISSVLRSHSEWDNLNNEILGASYELGPYLMEDYLRRVEQLQ